MASPKTAPAPAPVAPKPVPVVETANQTPEAARMKSPFVIEDNIPQPVKRIGVKGESMYPFDKLAIGQSFFVPVTEKVAEPWKTLTSMASRETKAQWPKKFITGRVKADEAKGTPEGVRIWRTTDGEGDAPVSVPRAKKDAAPVADKGSDPFATKAA